MSKNKLKIPQKKRFSKLETEASCVVRRTGVKVEWSKSKVFTEAMIAQCFEKYGEIDKVVVESKRNAKGVIAKSLEFIEDKKNQTKTESLLPEPSFLRDLENRLCYASRKNTLTETEFENRKQAFLEDADAKLILFCLSNKGGLDLDKLILVTEETKTDNDGKPFKKLPEMCDLLNIEHCSLPTLLENHYNIKLSKYLK